MNSTPLVSAGDQLSARQTICALASARSCVHQFKSSFVDGVVDESHLLLQENRISTLLSAELSRFPSTNCLIRNPNTDPKLQAPNFIANIPGIDLVENLSTISRNYELPHSVTTRMVSSGLKRPAPELLRLSSSSTWSPGGDDIQRFGILNLKVK